MSYRNQDESLSSLSYPAFLFAFALLFFALAAMGLCITEPAEAKTQESAKAATQQGLTTTAISAKAPDKPVISKASATEKSLTVKWSKSARAAGYQVRVSSKGQVIASKTVAKKSSRTTIKKLKPSTTYKVTVRAYSQAGSNKKYSKWSKAETVKTKERTYKISYSLNGGQQANGQRTSFKASSKTFKLLDPTRSGYQFLGWFDSRNQNSRVKSIAKGTKRNVSLFAKWKEVHEFVVSDEKKPTCTQDGYREETCKFCGKTQRMEIAATGHDMRLYYEEEPTCVSDGERCSYCVNCDYMSDETLPATGVHNIVLCEETSPTCSRYGYLQHWECDDCGEAFTDESGTEPLDKQTIQLPKTDTHDLMYSSSSATCTRSGMRGHYTCIDCGKYFDDPLALEPLSYSDLYVSALGHNYTTRTLISATCTSSGTANQTCTRCGDSHISTIPALGHSWVSGSTSSGFTCINGHRFTTPGTTTTMKRINGSYQYVYVSCCPSCSTTNYSRSTSTTSSRCSRCGATR